VALLDGLVFMATSCTLVFAHAGSTADITIRDDITQTSPDPSERPGIVSAIWQGEIALREPVSRSISVVT
jgi:hypothetical protein